LPRFGLATICLLVAGLLIPSSALAVLHTGIVELDLSGDGWDFSDSLHATPASGADIVLQVTALQPGKQRGSATAITDILFAFSPAAITYIGSADSTYEKLDTAPIDPDVYHESEAAFLGDVLVVRTREGHYAKLRIITPTAFFRFEYTYQDDGSPSFVPIVPVRPATWGRIKSLYRSD